MAKKPLRMPQPNALLRPITRRLGKPGLYAVHALALFLLVESMARVVWGLWDRPWGGLITPQRVTQLDDQLGWTLAPGARAWSKGTGVPVLYRVNEGGLRDAPRPLEKPPGKKRIVVVGDSSVFGFGLPEEARFSNILEGFYPDVEVINLGVPGYGLDQAWLRLQAVGFAYNPDLVVACAPHFSGERHMKDSLWGMGKPRIVFTDGTPRIENQPVSNNGFAFILLFNLNRLFEYSRAYSLLRDSAVSLFGHMVFRDETKPVLDPGAAPKEVDDPTPPETLATATAILEELWADCRQRRIDFALLTAVDDFGAEAIIRDIPTLNFRKAVKNRAFTLKHDPTRHYNEAGNGVIASELYNFLVENALPARPETVDASRFLTTLYADLGHPPLDPKTTQTLVAALGETPTALGAVNLLIARPETAALPGPEFVGLIHQAMLGRPSSPEELAQGLSLLERGGGKADLVAKLAAKREFRAKASQFGLKLR